MLTGMVVAGRPTMTQSINKKVKDICPDELLAEFFIRVTLELLTLFLTQLLANIMPAQIHNKFIDQNKWISTIPESFLNQFS